MKSTEDRIKALEDTVDALAQKVAMHIAMTSVPETDFEAKMRHHHAEHRRRAAAEAP